MRRASLAAKPPGLDCTAHDCGQGAQDFRSTSASRKIASADLEQGAKCGSGAARGDGLGWRDPGPHVDRREGPPLLLLHGAGGPNGWRRWHAALAERFTVYAPTHPGSANPIGRLDGELADLARYYLWYIDTLGLEGPRRRAVARRLHRGRAGGDEPATLSTGWCWSPRPA